MVATSVALDADAHVHRLFAHYANLPVGVVTQCATNHAALVHGAWHQDPRRSWAENAHALFARCDDYVFELLHQAASRDRQRAIWSREEVWARFLAAGPEVLDFGGGLGLASSLLADAGKRVTYCDVLGPAAAFAAWFFDQVGADVEMLQTDVAAPRLPAGRQWDLVLAEHVLEHVADPVATVETLAGAVRSGGLLHVLVARPGADCATLAHAVDLPALVHGSPTLRTMERVGASDTDHALFVKP